MKLCRSLSHLGLSRGLSFRAAQAVEGDEYSAVRVAEVRKREKLSGGQVRIRVDSAGVNNADLIILRGRHHLKPARPYVPGFELAGEVIEAGKEAEGRLSPGDRVLGLRRVGLGAWAEEAVVWADEVLPIPHRLSYERAAGLPVAYCSAMLALRGVEEGSNVLVLTSQGSTGLAAVDLAQNLFKCRVLAATDSEAKCAELRELGVAATIHLGEEDLHKRIHKATDGKGVAVVVDTIGGRVFAEALECLREGGRLCSLGFSSGHVPSVDVRELLRLQASVEGRWLGGWSNAHPEAFREMLANIIAYMDEGLLIPSPARVFALDEVGEALKAAHRDAAQLGKVILTLRPASPPKSDS